MKQPIESFDATYGSRDTPIEVRALRVIAKNVRITCATLGATLWGWHTAGNCSCPWARPAGRIFKRLREQKLVEPVTVESDPRTFYSITRKGEAHLHHVASKG